MSRSVFSFLLAESKMYCDIFHCFFGNVVGWFLFIYKYGRNHKDKEKYQNNIMIINRL